MTIRAGTDVTLTVMKEVSPYGYFLSESADGAQILLPYGETEARYKQADQVQVFLFHDSYDRLTATTRKPFIHLDELACLQVADLNPRLGCFLEMGIGKQLLLPVRELPEASRFWPESGDALFVVMEHDKQGRMLARLATEDDFHPLVLRAPHDWKNRWMKARVYKKLQIGDFAIVEGGVLGFGSFGMIHETERTRSLRLGELADVRVTYVREDGRVNLSMKPVKEVSRGEDAERILHVLRERPGGAMPYSDKTSADTIAQKFGISKSAFKRALGKLMKEGLVEQQDNWTRLSERGRTEE